MSKTKESIFELETYKQVAEAGLATIKTLANIKLEWVQERIDLGAEDEVLDLYMAALKEIAATAENYIVEIRAAS